MEKKPVAKTATKKKTTAKKPAATNKNGTPRKPYTKKPPVEAPKPVETGEEQLPDERKSRIEFGKMLEKDVKIPFIIPYDPENPQDEYWECGFNDLILRYKRGVVQYQPQYVVDFIMGRLKIHEAARRKTAEWQNSGKKISY